MTARTALPFVLAALLGVAGASAFAQRGPNPPPVTPRSTDAPAPVAPATVDPATGDLVENNTGNKKDAKIEHLVSEDSQVKIDETRVRGVTKKIVVHSKITGGNYEIQPKDPSLAPENDHGAGMRTFSWGF